MRHHPPQPHARRKRDRGFTIIELIISFTILTLALSGFAGMITASLKNFQASENRYIASQIAQEGMELVQNKADNQIECISDCPSDWKDNLVGDWEVQSPDTAALLPGGSFESFSPNDFICTRNDTGKFGYCSASAPGTVLPQKFTREVKITELNYYSIAVETTVRWGTDSVVLDSLIFNTKI